jgi:hypothetical protein
MDRVVRGFDPLRLLPGTPSLTVIGRKLFELNIEAVRQRYGRADDMVPDGWQIEDYQYNEPPPVPGCPSEIDSLKAMHCLIYQCSEGDVPERPLYQTLVETSQMLEQRIRDKHMAGPGAIEDLPAYQRAEW